MLYGKFFKQLLGEFFTAWYTVIKLLGQVTFLILAEQVLSD